MRWHGERISIQIICKIYRWFGTKPSKNLPFQTVCPKPSTNFTIVLKETVVISFFFTDDFQKKPSVKKKFLTLFKKASLKI
jgi:hypothetical protein